MGIVSSDKNELGSIFEYTAPGTPQLNVVVERVFVTVMGRARAMTNHAGFSMAKRQQLWCEAAQTSTLLDNILVQDSAKCPPFTQFVGIDVNYAKHLRVFGEMCVVVDTDNKVGRTMIVTGFYPSPKSFWSCNHVNSCQNHILYNNLHILFKI